MSSRMRENKKKRAASFYSYCFCERVLGCNWDLGFLRVFLCTIVFSLIKVKSLQLRGRRQITEPRKYCLVRVIVFFGVCFLYLFCFSQVGILVKFPTMLSSHVHYLGDMWLMENSPWHSTRSYSPLQWTSQRKRTNKFTSRCLNLHSSLGSVAFLT